MKHILLGLLFCLCLHGQAYAYYNALDGLLAAHVKPAQKNGVTYNGVDYKAWANDPRHTQVMGAITDTDPSTLKSKEAQLTFWINAYNILTIDLIVTTGEKKSIKNQGSLFLTPWQKHQWMINGKPYSLDDIEHKVLRKMHEPRIHFAINCAAISCPDLRRESYRPSKLNKQLESQTDLTLRNLTKGFSVEPNDSVRVSKIMGWFAEDFKDGDVGGWLKIYKPKQIKSGTDILFFDYNWALNAQ